MQLKPFIIIFGIIVVVHEFLTPLLYEEVQAFWSEKAQALYGIYFPMGKDGTAYGYSDLHFGGWCAHGWLGKTH